MENPHYAATLYRQAADAGDAEAQDMLSWMLLEGEIVPPDPAEALRLAEAAAAQGVAAAMFRLGMMHHDAHRRWSATPPPPRAGGRAPPPAATGRAGMLGAALHLGAGVLRDPFAAFVWLLRARAGGSALAYPFLRPAEAALPLEEAARPPRRRRAAAGPAP